MRKFMWKSRFLLLVFATGCDEAPEGSGVESATSQVLVCSEATQSRWAEVSGYETIRQYGLNEDQVISRFQGAAKGAGGLYVFDINEPHVLRFDDQLRVTHQLGRKGKGPGEFLGFPGIVNVHWIAADSSSVHAFDGQNIQEFSHDGQHLSQRQLPNLNVRRLALVDGRLYYATDEIHRQAAGRTLGIYRHGTADSLVASVSMPALPAIGGRFVSGGPVDQAQPAWAVSGNCHLVSDGSQWLYRLSPEGMDSSKLPSFDVPSDREEDRATKMRMAHLMGLSGADAERARPTAQARYSDLLMDPDGSAWLVRWTPWSHRYDPVVVDVFSRGAVVSVELPGTPIAFGPPGTLYVRRLDAISDVIVIERVRVKMTVGR